MLSAHLLNMKLLDVEDEAIYTAPNAVIDGDAFCIRHTVRLF